MIDLSSSFQLISLVGWSLKAVQKLSQFYQSENHKKIQKDFNKSQNKRRENFNLYDFSVANSKLKVGICKLGKVWISGGKALTYSRHLASATLEVWQNLGQHKLYKYSDNKTKQKTLFDKNADSKNTKHKHNTRQCGKTVKNTHRAENPDLFSADVSGWVKQSSDLKGGSKFPFS